MFVRIHLVWLGISTVLFRTSDFWHQLNLSLTLFNLLRTSNINKKYYVRQNTKNKIPSLSLFTQCTMNTGLKTSNHWLCWRVNVSFEFLYERWFPRFGRWVYATTILSILVSFTDLFLRLERHWRHFGLRICSLNLCWYSKDFKLSGLYPTWKKNVLFWFGHQFAVEEVAPVWVLSFCCALLIL